MPDPNGSRKPGSKNEGMKKIESSKTTHSSSLKAGDKRKSERETNRSPPRRRVARRSRSSSSGTSDSSSSRSGSADTSDSDSSRSGKRSPQKPSQSKHTKGSDVSKSSSRAQLPKTQTTASSKSEEVRIHREQPKKPQVSSDAPKVTESTRTDVQSRTKSGVIDDPKPAPTLPQSAKASSGPGEDKLEPTKPQNLAKPSTKPAKPSVIEQDKAIEESNKSPVNVPPFTRVLVEKLTRNVTKAHVIEIFSVWGEVLNVEMPPDRLHPEFSRSYAYVTYANHKCATDAVNYMNGGQVDGETIRVTEVFSRPSTTARTGADAAANESAQSRDRAITKRDSDKPVDTTRGRKDTLIPSNHHRSDGMNDRPRDYDRPSVNDQDRRREAQEKDRRVRDRERERQRDRSRDLDRPRRTRRGSSGSPFANRLGAVARQRSPVANTRYRRASPLSSRQDTTRRGRSRSPKPTKPGLSRSTNDTKSAPRGRATSRSSSSSSSGSGSSNSSSSSSHSGSSSSSSSSSSSRSR